VSLGLARLAPGIECVVHDQTLTQHLVIVGEHGHRRMRSLHSRPTDGSDHQCRCHRLSSCSAITFSWRGKYRKKLDEYQATVEQLC